MKKIFALTLSAVLLVGVLAGCGGSGKTGLADTWRVEMTLADFAEASGASSDSLSQASQYLDVDKISLAMVLELNDDGTYSLSMDEDSLVDFVDEMKDGTIAVLEDQADQLGMSLDEMLEESDMSRADLEEQLEEQFDIEEAKENTTFEGQYKDEDGKLYLSNDVDEEPSEDRYASYELDGDTLTLDEGKGELFDGLEDAMPLEFERG